MKNIFLFQLVFILSLGQAFSATGVSLPDDIVIVGKAGSSTNKEIKFRGTTFKIRANTSSGKLEFSNDGSNYSEFGSGSGTASSGEGGTNILSNSGFEAGVGSNWANTGGTFTSELYATPTAINLKFARLVTSGSGQYYESSLTNVPSFLADKCSAGIMYKGTSGNFLLKVLNSSNALLGSTTLAAISLFDQSAPITFTCPTSGTIKLRIESIGAGTIDTDEAYLGTLRNVANNQVTSLTAGTKVCSFKVGQGSRTSACSSSPCGVFDQVGACLTNVLWSSTGNTQPNWKPNYWTVAPNCTATSELADVNAKGNDNAPTTSVWDIKGRHESANSNQDIYYGVTCIGN